MSEIDFKNAQSILDRIFKRNIDQDSLVGVIAEKVAKDIIQGHLKSGDDLNSVELSKQFDTSRTPVREALLLLEKEGFVEIEPRRRPRVSHLSSNEIQDIYAVRANLYSLVAELVVQNASDNDIDMLEPPLKEMELAIQSNDLDAYFWPNVVFQDLEAKLSKNNQVQRILDSLMLRMLQLRYSSLSQPGRTQKSFEDHKRLLRAYKERDIALAVALKKGIVLRGLENIMNSKLTV